MNQHTIVSIVCASNCSDDSTGAQILHVSDSDLLQTVHVSGVATESTEMHSQCVYLPTKVVGSIVSAMHVCVLCRSAGRDP